MVVNGKLKRGDSALLTTDVSGWKAGTEVIITQVHASEPLYDAKQKKNPGFGAFSFYEHQLKAATREHQIALLKESIKQATATLQQLKTDLEILEKYPDEAAYLAAQIHAIIKNKGSVAAIAEILRKHKQTEFL